LYQADSLVRHLQQLAYDLSVGAMDKTYLIELVRDILCLWDQRGKTYHKRGLKPKFWCEIGKKFAAPVYSEIITLMNNDTNFKQRLLSINKNLLQSSSFNITCNNQTEKQKSLYKVEVWTDMLD
jgi:hypothetical protein